jgi:hypothetical protein
MTMGGVGCAVPRSFLSRSVSALSSLPGSFDVSNPMPMQRQRCCQDQEVFQSESLKLSIARTSDG